jgi:hypothetical protein
MSTQAPVALEQHVAETIAALARTLYPHDALPDEVYARVSAKLDEAAREDAAQARMIKDGVTDLDRLGGTPFLELDEDRQLEVLRGFEGTEYFELVRSTAVVELYDNPVVWKALGYEGPSTHLGGYLHRGFDDLDWLPDPPQAT